jgi:tubulin monoglycylase TTLL3/8
VKAECKIKTFVRELTESAMSEEGEIRTTIKPKVIETAIKVCERRLKDLDELIDDPKAFEKLVSDAEWRILGADELNEKKLKNKNHEKWLSSQNMTLPPRSKKKKKRKSIKPDTPVEEMASETESDISDGELEKDAYEKAICKKHPEYTKCIYILAELKKTFP